MKGYNVMATKAPNGAMSTPYSMDQPNIVKEVDKILNDYTGKTRGWGKNEGQGDSWGKFGDKPEWVDTPEAKTSLPQSEQDRILAEKAAKLAKEKQLKAETEFAALAAKAKESIQEAQKEVAELKPVFSPEVLIDLANALKQISTIKQLNQNQIVVQIGDTLLKITKA